MEGALHGVRVLDLAGPIGIYCTKLLADLGADVIRIEPPGGDSARRLGPYLDGLPDAQRSLYWFHFNTSKRGITLDIGTGDGRALFLRLAERADAVVESAPPGYLDRLGLGFSALEAVNPRVVLTSITPFGQTGPWQDYQATDLTGMAAGGLLFECGWPERPPVNMGGSQAYQQTGAQAATATLIALHARLWTGRGQHVDVSMQQCLPMCMLTRMPQYAITGEFEGRGGDIHRAALNGIFPCKDGWVDIRLRPRAGRWERVVAWIDAAGMAQDLGDPRYADFQFRSQRAAHLDEVFRPFFLTLTKEELMDQGQRAGFETGAVYSAEDVVNDPQLAARGFFTDVEHRDLGRTLRYTGAPYRLGATPWAIRRPAPRLGEHNSALYEGELGLSREDLVRLTQAGVL